ncbi:MAG TPA: hypothetical protein VFY48_02505 [Solirubrobacterales bacterium]|nr:hypothetical protein [Solirubrobacterales bacterium]
MRVAGLVLGLVLGLLALAPMGPASVSSDPVGPRLAVVKSGHPLAQEQLFTIDPLAEDPRGIWRFPGQSEGIDRVSWSGDGSALAWETGFAPESGVMVAPADGGRPRPVPGTRGAFDPALSPDGESIAFGRLRLRRDERGRLYVSASTIWTVDSAGGRPRRLTPLREGHFLAPSSFSPDGTRLAAVHAKAGGIETISLPLAGGPPASVADQGVEPAYSPDGEEIAFVRLKRRPRPPERRFPAYGGDLFVAAADGSSVRRLTFSPERREEAPSWDPSGQRLAYTQYPAKTTLEALTGTGSSIMEINADGSCLHRLLFTYGLSYRAAAWQPGPGREAGRIRC